MPIKTAISVTTPTPVFTTCAKHCPLQVAGSPNYLKTKCLAFYTNNGTDVSGNGKNLTAVGSPGTTTGFNGGANGAMVLGGGTAAFKSDTFSIIDPRASFSIGFWFNFFGGGFTANNYVAYFSRTTPTKQYPFCLVTSAGQVACGVDVGNNVFDDFSPLADSGWGYVLFTFDQPTNTQSLWCGSNGIELQTPQVSSISPLLAMQKLYVGGTGGGAPATDTINIQDLGFWNYCITGGTTNPGDLAVAGSDVDKLWNDGNGYNPFGTP